MNRTELLRLHGGQARYIQVDEPDQEYVIKSLMNYVEDRYNIEQNLPDERRITDTLEQRKEKIMDGLRILKSHYYPMTITDNNGIKYHMTLQIEYRTDLYPNCSVCIGIVDDDMKEEFTQTGKNFMENIINVLN